MKCNHLWQWLMPRPSELTIENDTNVTYAVDMKLQKGLFETVVCYKCQRVGYLIKSNRGGVRKMMPRYFDEYLLKAKNVAEKYGFDLPQPPTDKKG